MPTCSVPYCVNATKKDSHLTFHEFPHETPLFLNKWIENIGRPNWRPGLRSVVCCEHFQKDDFDRKGRLHVGSFPSKFPNSPFRKKKKVETQVDPSKSPSVQFSKPETFSKVKLPVIKAVHCINKNSRKDPVQIKVNMDECSAYSKSSERNENGGNLKEDVDISETSISVKVEGNLLPMPGSRMTSINDVVPEPHGPEIMKKRKVTEESQPVSPVTMPVASVSSSFSLQSCRICGHTSNLNTNIFGEEGKRLGLAKMINECLHIEVSESEPLPLSICNICVPRLKTCSELISNCQKTNNILRGENLSQAGTKDSDPPIIHTKPMQNQHPDPGNCRILLLEMTLVDGISVKDMINQSVQELTLRLKPKESRKSKPQGRIMFLDLQGGSETFPEQMKQAIARFFPGPYQKKSTEKSVKQDSSNSVSNLKSQLRPKLVSVHQTTPPTLVAKPLAPKVSSPNLTQNLLVQTTPMFSAVPLSIMSDSALSSSPIRVMALPHGLPHSSHLLPSPAVPQYNVNQILSLPTQSKCSVIKILPKPTTVTASPVSSSVDSPLAETKTKITVEKGGSPVIPDISDVVDEAVPPLVPIKEVITSVTTKEAATASTPMLDIAKMKDKVITKINNMGNQFKLGDKIVGIVVRNSDSSEDIQKKLQATFAKPASIKDKGKTVAKSKERTILPKGTTTISVNELGAIQSVEVVDEVKRSRDRPMDICPVADNPITYFDRRNARKLALSFMWRKTGFLVSSYQKLFTWQAPADDSDDTNPVLTCRVCKFAARSKSEVENHLQGHPDLQCSICSKFFLTVGKVHEHIKVIHHVALPADVAKRKIYITWRNNALKRPLWKRYQCARCDRKFKMKDALERHFTICKERTLAEKVVAITKSKLLACPVCNRSFPCNLTLQDHMLTHTKRTSWLCDICGAVLKSASNYRSHIARHDENAHEYRYQCDVCKKRFKLENRYEYHIKKHEEKREFICSSCGKVFHSPNGLRQHEILHGERKLQCRFCPSRFHRRDHLRIHEASHNKPQRNDERGPRFFTCRYCAVSSGQVIKFPNMRLLMRHYQDDHADERGTLPGSLKYCCDRCNKSFANSTLLRHHHMWHAGLRPYSCSTCGAGFMVKERLRNHELSHTNERPYKCQTCGKGFRSRNCLKQHKLIHKDPSEFYRCKYCDKGFSRIDNLRTHIRVHTGEKPWKCLHCQKQFRLRSDCTKHIHNAHQVPQDAVFDHMETLIEPNDRESTMQTSVMPSAVIDPAIDAAVDAAVADMTTVTTMELLIEDDDLEECEQAI